jgi:hypothetical protein
VNKIRELQGIPFKKDRGIVANDIPDSFLGIKKPHP